MTKTGPRGPIQAKGSFSWKGTRKGQKGDAALKGDPLGTFQTESSGQVKNLIGVTWLEKRRSAVAFFYDNHAGYYIDSFAYEDLGIININTTG